LRIPARRASIPNQCVGGGHDAKNHHEAAEEEASDAETAVNVGAAGGNERGLGYEEKDPGCESGAVDVNDRAGQRGTENPCEKIAARETDEDGDQHEQRATGEEVVVVTAAGQADWRAHTCDRLRGNCCQEASEKWGRVRNTRRPGN